MINGTGFGFRRFLDLLNCYFTEYKGLKTFPSIILANLSLPFAPFDFDVFATSLDKKSKTGLSINFPAFPQQGFAEPHTLKMICLLTPSPVENLVDEDVFEGAFADCVYNPAFKWRQQINNGGGVYSKSENHTSRINNLLAESAEKIAKSL